ALCAGDGKTSRPDIEPGRGRRELHARSANRGGQTAPAKTNSFTFVLPSQFSPEPFGRTHRHVCLLALKEIVTFLRKRSRSSNSVLMVPQWRHRLQCRRHSDPSPP